MGYREILLAYFLIFWRTGIMKKIWLLSVVLLFTFVSICFAQSGTYLGNLSSNPYAPNSLSNSFGTGSPYNPNSLTNSYGTFGSPYSDRSSTNPFATNPPKLYDSQGQYRGNLSANPYDPNSTSNPYGRYGSKYSPDSLNNPFGAGSPYKQDSPNNRFGKGWSVWGQ
jgi:hypothetical protein